MKKKKRGRGKERGGEKGGERRKRTRERNSFHCIAAIYNLFHHLPLVYSFNKKYVGLFHFGFIVSEIIMFYPCVFSRYLYLLTKSRQAISLCLIWV